MGQPTRVTVEKSSGHQALDQAALDAVRGARFRPYFDGAKAEVVWILVPITRLTHLLMSMSATGVARSQR